MTELTAEIREAGTAAVIQVGGYVSGDGSDALQAAFVQTADSDRIVLSFGERDFINSAGLAVLFDLILPRKAKGVEFRIAHPAKHFRKVFEIVGLSKDVGVFESEDEALKGW